jgi:hypothetical protein
MGRCRCAIAKLKRRTVSSAKSWRRTAGTPGADTARLSPSGPLPDSPPQDSCTTQMSAAPKRNGEALELACAKRAGEILKPGFEYDLAATHRALWFGSCPRPATGFFSSQSRPVSCD